MGNRLSCLQPADSPQSRRKFTYTLIKTRTIDPTATPETTNVDSISMVNDKCDDRKTLKANGRPKLNPIIEEAPPAIDSVEAIDIGNQIESCTAELLSLQRINANLEKKMLEQDLELSRLQRAHSLFNDWQKPEDQNTGTLSKMQREIGKLKQENCALQKENLILKSKIDAMQKQLLDFSAKLCEMKREHNKTTGHLGNEIGDLRKNITELEAEKEAISAQMKTEYDQMSGKLGGIIGRQRQILKQYK